MLMVVLVASPNWMNTSVLVMGSSSLAEEDAAIEDVMVVLSWANMPWIRKVTRMMNCSTLMMNDDWFLNGERYSHFCLCPFFVLELERVIVLFVVVVLFDKMKRL